ncbi:MAG: sigma 54-interacting transcriptional regulator [Pseudomonadota bacterium]|uniref:sigma-54 interaction domain-containing protein n=1 Tax=Salinicola salarius TaxID=430457 RepID=UPI000B402EE7|nr:sigma 54-interacting transcriptional regulator [Salinicola salarius]MED5501670.1 sigma 54-interacting transcriptional regulator [Pseudomonadota bacterium]
MEDSISDEAVARLTLETLIQTAQDHLFIVDGDGRILDVSPGSAAVYGLRREALCATTVQALQASGVLSPSVSLEVIRTGQPAQIMQRTGTGRQVIAEAFPVYADGKLIRVISRSRDLTDLRLLQDEYALLQRRFAEHLKRHHEPDIDEDASIGELVVKSRIMREMVYLLKRSAPTDATVLMLGESGVGKTAFARQLHRWSRRSDGDFVDVNCAAIPESLFESEMFGYQPGAFSGASRQGKAGLLEQAHGGTLFLDEIGELPLSMQAKLLKVIQDGSLMRLGDTRSRQVDFRLVVATNQDLARRVEEGTFRLDLYYRLNVIPVTLPPLRERREDIRGLTERYLGQLNRRYGEEKVLHPSVWATLMSNDWPGNIRELENWLERAWLSAEGGVVGAPGAGASSVGSKIPHDAAFAEPGGETRQANAVALAPGQSLKAAMNDHERGILEALVKTCRTTYALADRLGISQPSVVRKLRRHGLRLER